MHNLMPVGFSHVFIYEWLFTRMFICCCNVIMVIIIIIYSTVWFLYGWCHAKLPSCRRTFCVHHVPYRYRVLAYFAVTCHLHFWQNDQDPLRATAVTRGWNGYRNKSAQKVDPGEEIPPPLLHGFEPVTFRSWVRRCNHWAIPASQMREAAII